MKSIVSVVLAVALLGATVFVGAADAGDRRHGHKQGGAYYGYADHGYIRPYEVVLIREYYQPYYRPLPPGLAKKYYRTGHLPPGWAKRMRPVPVYIERQMVPVPYGYHRGVIDGHVVVHNGSGFILDVGVLF